MKVDKNQWPSYFIEIQSEEILFNIIQANKILRHVTKRPEGVSEWVFPATNLVFSFSLRQSTGLSITHVCELSYSTAYKTVIDTL